jgi:hypothetical protein
MEKKTNFVIDSREAMGDNSAWVLNIDGAAPGRIFAYVDEHVQAQINEQLAKRAETSGVIGPHREGHTVDGVSFSANLRDILTTDPMPFDSDVQIDAWIAELESLAQRLRDFQARRHVEAAAIFCMHCSHSLLDHEGRESADLSCRSSGCNCQGFFPIESQTLN